MDCAPENTSVRMIALFILFYNKHSLPDQWVSFACLNVSVVQSRPHHVPWNMRSDGE